MSSLLVHDFSAEPFTGNHLPTNLDIIKHISHISIVSRSAKKKNVAEAVHCLLEKWRITSIPIVALTTVKRRVLNLLEIRADHVKNRPVGTDGLNIRREYWDSLFDICDHSQDHLLSNKDKCFIASQQSNCGRTMSLEEYSRMDIQNQVILVPDSFFLSWTQNQR